MNIILTNHARKRMAFRGVTINQIRIAIDHPDQVKSIVEISKKRISKHFGKRVLDVVYEEKNETAIIITVIWLGEEDRYHAN